MNKCNYTVAFFILTAFVTSLFTKNMILVLGGSIALTNTFMICKVVKEKFTGGYEVEGMKNKKEGNENEEKKKEKKEENTEEKKKEEGTTTENLTSHEDNDKEEEFTGFRKNNNQLDYAATVENAYGDLDKILGSDGIKNLTRDTERLMKEQQKLGKVMENMGPMVGQVKEMMKSMGGSKGMEAMMAKAGEKLNFGN
tara:strand:+ start:1426 stop:2016 length:591 start_codon:yes stop_codon:yes gene_type:complete